MEVSDKILEAFGELLYAIINADGEVRPKEKEGIEAILANYPFGETVFWSFSYEANNHRSVQEAYDRAMDAFTDHGPSAVYQDFFQILDRVNQLPRFSLSERTKRIAPRFKAELIKHFAASAESQTDYEEL